MNEMKQLQKCTVEWNLLSTRYLLHIYIHNWPLQPFSWFSHTTYLVCVNFIHKLRDLQFKVGSEPQNFLRNFSCQILFTHSVFARNLLRKNRQRNSFRISFWCLVFVWTVALRLISQYTIPRRLQPHLVPTWKCFNTTWSHKICSHWDTTETMETNGLSWKKHV